MSDTQEIALCIVNDGASYAARCEAYRTMNARDFRAYALGLVNDKMKTLRRQFGSRFKQHDIDKAVADLVSYHDMHAKDLGSAESREAA